MQLTSQVSFATRINEGVLLQIKSTLVFLKEEDEFKKDSIIDFLMRNNDSLINITGELDTKTELEGIEIDFTLKNSQVTL